MDIIIENVTETWHKILEPYSNRQSRKMPDGTYTVLLDNKDFTMRTLKINNGYNSLGEVVYKEYICLTFRKGVEDVIMNIPLTDFSTIVLL